MPDPPGVPPRDGLAFEGGAGPVHLVVAAQMRTPLPFAADDAPTAAPRCRSVSGHEHDHSPAAPSVTVLGRGTLVGADAYGPSQHARHGPAQAVLAEAGKDLLTVTVGAMPGVFDYGAHLGPVLVVVTRGELAYYESRDGICTAAGRFRAGQAYVHPGRHNHLGRAEGAERFEGIFVSLNLPTGRTPYPVPGTTSTPRDAEPAPTCSTSRRPHRPAATRSPSPDPRGVAVRTAFVMSGIAALGAAFLPVAHSAAVPPTAAKATVCKATYDLVVRPGLSTQKRKGSNYTPKPGTISCDGPVLGRRVAGPGKITTVSRFGLREGASCLGGDGVAALISTFPLPNGSTLTVFDSADFEFGGLQRGLIAGTFTGDTMDGAFRVTPLKGDCVTSPVTRARIDVSGTLHAYRPAR